MQIHQALKNAAEQLSESSDSPRLDAEVLLAWVLEKNRTYLHTWPEKTMSQEDAQGFQEALRRRINGEPVAHIIGLREFWSMDLNVTPDTLIPRPETELLVELALQSIPVDQEQHILDLGTGSGAIALAIARERPLCKILAVEKSAEALQVARGNAKRYRLHNITFFQGEWFSPVQDLRFHLIVSNPPYIADQDPHLLQGDVRHEPRTALASGPEGLDDLSIIISQAARHLYPGGRLLLEHGYHQGKAVLQLLGEYGFVHTETCQDLAGHDRVSGGSISG